MLVTLNVIYINKKPVVETKIIYTKNINLLSIAANELGTSVNILDYIDNTPILNNYIVTQTVDELFNLIKNAEIENSEQAQKFDYDLSGNLLYLGSAQPGSVGENAVWQISKFNYDVDGNLLNRLWANGNTLFINIWNNRVSLSYS